MRRKTWSAVALCCLFATACGKKEPTGQVAAIVDKQEITTNQINQELNGFNAPTPQARKQAERGALDRILARKVLAKAAKDAGMDKSPDFATKQQRVNEELLVQSWQESIAKSVPPPSPEEIQKFVDAHPDVYGQHKVLQLDQIRLAKPTDPAVLKGLQPLNTTADVAAYLTQHNIGFRQAPDQLDLLSINPEMAEGIMKLPPTEMFALPAGNLIVINRVVSANVVPVPPDVQNKIAGNFLRQLHTQEAIGNKFRATLAAARKDVQYNKEYQPPAPPKVPAAAAPKK